MSTRSIDINADLGEGGAHDRELFELISSANIACGYHAGDEATMRESVRLAREHGVAIGAHPSLDDRPGFGRVWFDVPSVELRDQVTQQVSSLQRICVEEGAVLIYVKAHGALYNQATTDETTAIALVRGVGAVDPALRIFAQPRSVLERVATNQGLPVIREAFADCVYNADGILVSRTIEGSVLQDAEAIAQRIIRLISTGELDAIAGQVIRIPADTICIHSDTPGTVAIARTLVDRLREAGVEIRPSS